MKPFKHLGLIGMTATLLGASTAVASADPPPPYGLWASAGNEQLLVNEDNTCSFGVNGQPNTVGSCTWQSSGDGGILTINDTLLYRTAPIYFNVVWIDDSDISIRGDPFHRIG